MATTTPETFVVVLAVPGSAWPDRTHHLRTHRETAGTMQAAIAAALLEGRTRFNDPVGTRCVTCTSLEWVTSEDEDVALAATG